ncbi:hypothetical protein PV08_11325 [Exophiala spinifera]|uniref:Uncharacterized protein n=1 Tax=Exophiala spinifera TaxID=91928 RepID=A0A0D2AUF3_9EURO|nr:uncharacterized protein PV08_11325 [Exophiala spinifera]KIW10363.1 hypothetical protein PV08_11325 [Exophiala spinifera]
MAMASTPITTSNTPSADQSFLSSHLTLPKEDTDRYEIKSRSLHPTPNMEGEYMMPRPGHLGDVPEAPPLADVMAEAESAGSSVPGVQTALSGAGGNGRKSNTGKEKGEAQDRKPRLRVKTHDIPLPLFPTKQADHNESSASSLAKFQESLEQTMTMMMMMMMTPQTPRVEDRRIIPEIQINGQAIREVESEAKQQQQQQQQREQELSSPVREWLEKRRDRTSRARKKGTWIEMWKHM